MKYYRQGVMISQSFMRLVSLQSLGISCTRESWLLLSSIFSQSLCLLPTYICLGLLILLVFSFIISHQWAIQPTLRATAKSTVNMSLGIPMALYTMPVQKSTLGQSFLLMKQSSERASFSRLMARSSSGLVSWSWMVSSTEQHIFCMMVARGSKFLQTRCPKPMRRKLEFLSFERSIISEMEAPSCRISSSMFSTASLAPPWQGPQSDPMPAAMHAKGLACELPAILTVEVEAFCSCSAWQIQMTSSARRTPSSMSKESLMGLENIMQRKFFMQPKCFFGQTIGSPIAVLYAYAASVGIFAISFIAISCLSRGLNRSQSECRNADSAPTTPTMIAIGCASLRKPLQNSIIFSLIIISPVTTSQNLASSLLEGSWPQSSRQDVSRYVECSANSSMRYPRQSSSPFSPLMQQMLEMQLAVHMNPGSQVSSPACPNNDLTSMSACPSEPLSTGSSYSLPSKRSTAFSSSAAGSTGFTSDRSSLSFIAINQSKIIYPSYTHLYPACPRKRKPTQQLHYLKRACFAVLPDQGFGVMMLLRLQLRSYSVEGCSSYTKRGLRLFSQKMRTAVWMRPTRRKQAATQTQLITETQSSGLQTGLTERLKAHLNAGIPTLTAKQATPTSITTGRCLFGNWWVFSDRSTISTNRGKPCTPTSFTRATATSTPPYLQQAGCSCKGYSRRGQSPPITHTASLRTAELSTQPNCIAFWLLLAKRLLSAVEEVVLAGEQEVGPGEEEAEFGEVLHYLKGRSVGEYGEYVSIGEHQQCQHSHSEQTFFTGERAVQAGLYSFRIAQQPLPHSSATNNYSHQIIIIIAESLTACDHY